MESKGTSTLGGVDGESYSELVRFTNGVKKILFERRERVRKSAAIQKTQFEIFSQLAMGDII